jgi:hypothetical protein
VGYVGTKCALAQSRSSVYISQTYHAIRADLMHGGSAGNWWKIRECRPPWPGLTVQPHMRHVVARPTNAHPPGVLVEDLATY